MAAPAAAHQCSANRTARPCFPTFRLPTPSAREHRPPRRPRRPFLHDPTSGWRKSAPVLSWRSHEKGAGAPTKEAPPRARVVSPYRSSFNSCASASPLSVSLSNVSSLCAEGMQLGGCFSQRLSRRGPIPAARTSIAPLSRAPSPSSDGFPQSRSAARPWTRDLAVSALADSRSGAAASTSSSTGTSPNERSSALQAHAAVADSAAASQAAPARWIDLAEAAMGSITIEVLRRVVQLAFCTGRDRVVRHSWHFDFGRPGARPTPDGPISSSSLVCNLRASQRHGTAPLPRVHKAPRPPLTHTFLRWSPSPLPGAPRAREWRASSTSSPRPSGRTRSPS